MKNTLTLLFCLVSIFSFGITDTINWNTNNTPIPNRRMHDAFFVIDSFYYVVAGEPNASAPTREVWKYNIPANTWTRMNDFPGGRIYYNMGCAVNGKGYVAGGFDTTNHLGNFWEYNPIADSWLLKPQPDTSNKITQGVSFFGYGNKLYLIATAGISGGVMQYDPSTSTWQMTDTVPTCTLGDSYSSAAVIDSFVYIIGAFNTGTCYGGFMGENRDNVWRYNLNSKNWALVSHIPGIMTSGGYPGRYGAQVWPLENSILVGGGVVHATTHVPDYYRYTPATNQWDTIIMATFADSAAYGDYFVYKKKAYFGNYQGHDWGAGQVAWPDTFYSFDVSRYYKYTSISAGVCAGSSYNFHGRTLTTAGTYIDTLQNHAGQDSLIRLTLSVWPAPTAHFTLSANPTTAHSWYALNQCTSAYAPLTYQWTWGDGSATATGATPSHTYSTAGWYNLCVSVTDANHCTASYCDSSYLSKMNGADAIVSLDVVSSLPNGISSINADNPAMLVVPNPCINCEIQLHNVRVEDLQVTDIMGRIIHTSFEKTAYGYSFHMQSQPAGIYLIHDLHSGRVVKLVRE